MALQLATDLCWVLLAAYVVAMIFAIRDALKRHKGNTKPQPAPVNHPVDLDALAAKVERAGASIVDLKAEVAAFKGLPPATKLPEIAA